VRGTTVTADEEVEMDLATQVEPAESLGEVTRTLAAELAENPPVTTRLTKELLAADCSFEEYVRATIDAQ
jgi:enoyl-CoA hydratase/carnithine racemase